MNKFFQVSSIVDEFVFAREGAAKGNGGLNRIYERRVDQLFCAECDLLVEVSHSQWNFDSGFQL